MATSKNVLIIGPGLIGWNVLDLLVAEGYSVTGFVRRKEHADGIRASGGSIVMGDLNDKALITEQATQHDVVIHTATADHLPSVEAVLDGVKKRASNGQMTIFIHTSGTSVLDDKSKGMYRGDKIYRDDVRSQIDSVPDDAPHREIDLAIVKAQRELGEKAKMAIMIPPLIYGYSHGRGTIQIPTLTRFALKHGYVPYLGKGLGVESNINVLDLARAYLVVLHHLESSAPVQTLENPYFFCECTGDDEPSCYDVSAHIASSMHKIGASVSPEPRPIEEDMYEDLFGVYSAAAIGLNSRSRAVRLRELGWEARGKDWRRSFAEDELPEILKEDGSRFRGYTGAVASGAK